MGKTKKYTQKNAHPIRSSWDQVHEDPRFKKRRIKELREQDLQSELDEDEEESESTEDYFWRNQLDDDWEKE